MRLNAIPPSFVAQPGMGPEIGGIAGMRGIGAQASGATLVAPQGPSEQGVITPLQAPAVDRRGLDRRRDERRKQKLPILLEMRVGPRRTNRRRSGDEPPASVDTKV